MILALIGLIAGALLSALHLMLLQRQARSTLQSAAWWKIALASALRLLAIGGFLLLLAQAGAAILLGALLGFLLVRSTALAQTVFRHG